MIDNVDCDVIRNGSTHIADIKCTALDPFDTNGAAQLATEYTVENRLPVKQTFIAGTHDIDFGDYLLIGGVQYYIRVVNEWPGTEAYLHILCEDPARADECVHMTYGSTTDAYGNDTDTYTDGDTLTCLVGPARTNEALGVANVPTATNIVRLPFGSTVSAQDRIRVTKRFGSTVASPVVYDIVGTPEIGASGLIARLNKVTE